MIHPSPNIQLLDAYLCFACHGHNDVAGEPSSSPRLEPRVGGGGTAAVMCATVTRFQRIIIFRWGLRPDRARFANLEPFHRFGGPAFA